MAFRSAPFEPSIPGFIVGVLMWCSGPWLLFHDSVGLGLFLTIILAPVPMIVLAMLIGRERQRRADRAT